MHPQSRVRKIESTRGSHHRFTGITRHSPRNGFTTYNVISPVIGLGCHRRFAKLLPQNLNASVEASGPHDFAVRVTCRSSSGTSASIASRPAFVAIAIRPSWWDETAAVMDLIWVKREAIYFCNRGWTEKSLICPSGTQQ